MKDGIQQRISELSKLDDLDYDLVRKDEASKLGISVAILDKQVSKARPVMQMKEPEDPAEFFTLLGHNKGHYFYFARQKGQIVSYNSVGHSRIGLLELAPEDYWFRNYFDPRRNEVNIVTIASDLITRSHQIGIFDINNVRGRGAWWDKNNGGPLFHLGDKLFVNGEYRKPGKFNGCIYENNIALTDGINNPITKEGASVFYDICRKLQWRDPAMASFLAGYCVVAHIGGALDWRPHIWLNGGAGTGKSWIISKVVRPIFGMNCLFISGNTTEAFIRQALGNDSIPVLFDEAEGNTDTAVKRIQNVLELARQSSSQTGAIQGKGTTTGRPMSFNVRSCFAMASINATIVQSADSSRITTLEIVPDNTGRFSDLEKLVSATITEDYCSGFMARAIKMVPMIRKNSKILSSSVAEKYGTQRTGDQLGTLLAGLWSLLSDDEITKEQADDLVMKNFMSEKKQEDEENNDAAKCWLHLMQSFIDVKFDKGHERLPVGEMIDIATAARGRPDLTDTQAEDVLVRYGIKVDALGVTISNSHPELKKIYASTPFASAWCAVMRRLDGARLTENQSFGSRIMKSRGVFVPHNRG